MKTPLKSISKSRAINRLLLSPFYENFISEDGSFNKTSYNSIQRKLTFSKFKNYVSCGRNLVDNPSARREHYSYDMDSKCLLNSFVSGESPTDQTTTFIGKYDLFNFMFNKFDYKLFVSFKNWMSNHCSSILRNSSFCNLMSSYDVDYLNSNLSENALEDGAFFKGKSGASPFSMLDAHGHPIQRSLNFVDMLDRFLSEMLIPQGFRHDLLDLNPHTDLGVWSTVRDRHIVIVPFFVCRSERRFNGRIDDDSFPFVDPSNSYRYTGMKLMFAAFCPVRPRIGGVLGNNEDLASFNGKVLKHPPVAVNFPSTSYTLPSHLSDFVKVPSVLFFTASRKMMDIMTIVDYNGENLTGFPTFHGNLDNNQYGATFKSFLLEGLPDANTREDAIDVQLSQAYLPLRNTTDSELTTIRDEYYKDNKLDFVRWYSRNDDDYNSFKDTVKLVNNNYPDVVALRHVDFLGKGRIGGKSIVSMKPHIPGVSKSSNTVKLSESLFTFDKDKADSVKGAAYIQPNGQIDCPFTKSNVNFKITI